MGSRKTDFFLALRTVALADVIGNVPEYTIRHIFRWYSREFHVPLPEVGDLPMDHIFQTYYECQYEKMDPEDRDQEKAYLLESDEDRRKRLADEERRAVEDLEYERAAAAEAAKANKMEAEKKVDEAKTIARLAEGDTKPFAEILKPGTKLPPNISLSFMPDDEFEAALEASSAGDLDTDNLPIKPHSPPTLK